MLTTGCIHPGIMRTLSLCGHGSKILIADGNYPLDEKTGDADKVYLGLSPGLPTVTDVLDALLSVACFEKAEVMLPEDGSEPEIFKEFRTRLSLPLEGHSRSEFYEASKSVMLAVSTGEKRTYANLLLTLACP